MRLPKESVEIISRIKEIRLKKGLSQAKFAELVGVSQGNVGCWETGKAMPSAIALRNIAKNLNVSIDWILLGNLKLNESPVLVLKESSPEYLSSHEDNKIPFDPDTRDMIDAVKFVMSDPDPDVRAWAKIQLRRAFAEYFEKAMEKKEHA